MNKLLNILKLIVLLTSVFISYSIFSDWQNFKAGLKGRAPVEVILKIEK